jgi:hypothetical protein
MWYERVDFAIGSSRSSVVHGSSSTEKIRAIMSKRIGSDSALKISITGSCVRTDTRPSALHDGENPPFNSYCRWSPLGSLHTDSCRLIARPGRSAATPDRASGRPCCWNLRLCGAAPARRLTVTFVRHTVLPHLSNHLHAMEAAPGTAPGPGTPRARHTDDDCGNRTVARAAASN